jgi:hypothetical protein
MTVKTRTVTVSESDVQVYQEKGYWVSPVLLDTSEIEKLRKAFNRIFLEDFDRELYPFDRVYNWDLQSPQLRKLNNGWWLNDDVRSVVLSPKLGCVAARLMQTDEVRVWHDQVVIKPGVGSEGRNYLEGNIGWHQDYAHWQVSSSQEMCTLWIALQDTDLSNGGMRTVIGSHKWGLAPDADSFHDKDLEMLKRQYSAKREWIEEPCILEAGQGSVHHCLCFHGSGPNTTDEPRMALIIHYMPKGTYYRGRIKPPGEVLPGRKGNRHANVPLLGPNARPGTPFDGECFPRVWPPGEDFDQLAAE